MRGRSRSATSDRLTASTRSMACRRSRRSSSSLADRRAADSAWTTISASATCEASIGCSSGPLEVDDPEQLAAVNDRGRDLAPDVVAGRAIVGIGEHIGDELGLPASRRRVR